MSRFDGRVAVVTGAGQGIGKETARLLAKEGAKVGIFEINEETANAVAEEINSEGGTAIGIKCDVSNAQDVEAGMKKLVDSFGSVDILVNNAGITRDALLFRMEEDEWDSVINTHLKGAFLCSKEAQKYMVKNKYGKIINLSSRSALGNRGQTNYSAAKAGLQGMTRTMAIELEPFGINVNAVAPGFVETDMTKGIAEKTGTPYEEVKENAIKQNSIKRVGTPADIANAILFLASAESEYITGQILYVTGRPTV